MPDLKEFHLGIIGGCLSHQSDIPHSQLYHRQLDRFLQEGQGIRLKVAITRHFDCDYKERLNALLDEVQVDGVLLHLRVVFTAKSALLVNQLNNGKRYYRLHPFLYKQHETGWNKSLIKKSVPRALFAAREPVPASTVDEDPFEHPTPSKKIFGFRLRSLNLVAGTLAGLDDWAIADELDMFTQFKDACRQRDMPFFVLGPTPVTTYSSETRLWLKMNRILNARLKDMDVPFCLLEQMTDGNGTTILRGDGLHLNEAGHTYVAKQLYETMTSWVREKLEKVNKWT
jgi:hypothetical protein